MEYETTKEVAERLGVTPAWIRQQAQEGWFPGAKREGYSNRATWWIPRGSKPVKPEEEIKRREEQ